MVSDLTCQTPHFEETTLSLTMSYSSETKTTIAFVILCSGEMEEFINTLGDLASLCKSPLFLPTAFYWTMGSLFSKRMQSTQKRLRDVEINNGKLKHIHRGEQASRDRDSDSNHIVLVEAHYELTRGLAEFVENLGERLCRLSHSLEGGGPIASDECAVDERWPRSSSTVVGSNTARSLASVSASEGDPDRLPISGHALTYEHKELNRLIRRTNCFVQESLLKRKRLERRIDVQMQILYDLKQTRIAEATYIDSAAMKSLALLTMVFLPPNAVATIFGANNLFTTKGEKVNGVTETFSTVFIPTSICVVAVVAVSWILYTYWYDIRDWIAGRQHRNQRGTRRNLEPPRCGKGVCEPPRADCRRRLYDVEMGSDYERSERMQFGPMHCITSSNSSSRKKHRPEHG